MCERAFDEAVACYVADTGRYERRGSVVVLLGESWQTERSHLETSGGGWSRLHALDMSWTRTFDVVPKVFELVRFDRVGEGLYFEPVVELGYQGQLVGLHQEWTVQKVLEVEAKQLVVEIILAKFLDNVQVLNALFESNILLE